MKYKIESCDYDERPDSVMNQLLQDGWEPFAVVRETRSTSGFDPVQGRDYTDRALVDVIWLRKAYA